MFAPDRPVTRAQFALILEDVIMRVKDDPDMATRHIGKESPFGDVHKGYYAFNAIMTAPRWA